VAGQAAQPAVLARHWAEAGEAEAALATWRKAGDGARARNAHKESREAYRHALSALRILPDSPERDARELELLGSLIEMTWVTEGFIAPNTVELSGRARELAERTGDLPKLVRQVRTAWVTRVFSGEYLAAAPLADQLSELAERDGDVLAPGVEPQQVVLGKAEAADGWLGL